MRYHLAYFTFAVFLVGMAAAGQNTPQAPVAQKSAIEGTVTSGGSGQPLKNVRITVQRMDPPAGQNARGRGAVAGALGGDAGGAAQGQLAALLGNIVGAARGAVTSVTTDSAGRFAVTGLDAGQYRISASRDGFIPQEYGRRTPNGSGQPASITAGQRFAADLQLAPAGVIAGRVRDESGEAVFRATVQAYTYRYSGGDRTLAQVATGQTNDLGEYRLFWLPPGDYFVSVNAPQASEAASTVDASAPRGGGARQGAAANVAATAGGLGQALQLLGQGQQTPGGPAPIYYPGTIDPDAAAPVAMTASAELRGIDFNLRPVPTATVSGRVVAPFALGQNAARGQQPAPRGGAQPNAGTQPNAGARGARGGGQAGQTGIAALLEGIAGGGGGQNAQVSLSRIGGTRNGLAALGLGNSVPVGADGAFEIRGVVPGAYYLNARANQDGKAYTARVRLDVSGSDIGNVVVPVRAGVQVHGKIVVDSPPAQFKMTQVRVNLIEEGNAIGNLVAVGGDLLRALTGGANGQAGNTQVAEDGTFTLQNVASSVEHRVRISNASGGYLLDGRIGSDDALNAPFTVGDQDTTLQLQVSFATGKVTGTVVDSSGKLYSGAQAVLVPDGPRRGRPEMYFSAATDQNGAFNFANVPSGVYKMFAWEEVPAGAYQYPDFLRRYENLGVSIRVEKGGTAGGELKVIPATIG